ncbi:MAG: TldD/PmbA family protein [Candidatus Lokiarchaeota archaeon]|nr:TldD/PmbA family protein [Candidatus Lokiarchaeota archaeon]
MSLRFSHDDLDLEPKVNAITAIIQGYQDIKHYEIYCSAQSVISIELEKDAIKTAEFSKDIGIGVRLANGHGQSAFSYTSDLSAGSMQQMVKRIVALVGKSTRDKDFHSFAEKTPVTKLPASKLFDKRIEGLEIEDATSLVFDTLERARGVGDPRIYSVNIDLGAGSEKVLVLNSNGVDAREQYTSIDLSCSVTSKSGRTMTSDSDFQAGRALGMVSAGVGESAARRSLATLGKVRIKTGVYPIILSPRAAAAVIGSTIEEAADAELLQQQKSFLSSEAGERIAPEFLSIVDNAKSTRYSCLNSRSFDGEGTGSTTTKIVDEGVFRSGLYDSYTAGKGGTKNTANASRASYRSLPGISPSNMIIQADKAHVAKLDEIVAGIKLGILFDDTGDSPDVASGDFSGLISTGFLIQAGAIARPVSLAAFGINFRDLLNGIELVGDDVKDVAGTVCPSILLKGVQISSEIG